MHLFQSFALDGLWFPAFQIAFGTAMIIRAYRQMQRPEGASANSFQFSQLSSRRWQARAGWVMIAGGLLTAILRLTR